MNNFYSVNMPNEYVNKVANQPFVPGQNFKPIIIKELLTNEELEILRKDFNKYPLNQIRVQGHNGMGNLDIDFSNKQNIIKKVEKLVSDISGEEVEVLEANSVRYSPSFGWFVKFGPHYDARPVEMFVLDYHVQATEDWAVFVEGEKFNVQDNEALLFNGTGQVHWREQKRLNDNANIDLVLFWIQHKTPKLISKEHTDTMRERGNWVLDIINPPPTLKRGDWWKSIQISTAALKYPDFKKISSEHKNPLSHNSVYHNMLLNIDDLKHFSSPNPDGTTAVSRNVINKINTFMIHVHAESKIEYLDATIMRYNDSNKNMVYKYNDNKNIVSLAILIDSNIDFRIIIDDKTFGLQRFSSLTFSPTNQDLRIDINSNNNESFVDMIFFNFWLKESY